ncbi:uncharacterized protein LOC119666315 [Teleopsis dalmanni]|uniref:uncharacterized protein LOC119666315 n=1 Tax=Teleopsis dalmanni TaxID=139649 RepID=UPI0018CCE562|nr:uncharacterized protein LOC119666315 [Teleopsis dalmanni]
MATKKIRGDNWTAEDKTLLKELVRENMNCIENKNTDTNTNKAKQNAWINLHECFNEMGSVKRSVVQLKAQWSIIKMNAKKEKTKERREILQTGGGPHRPAEALGSDDISVWLPNEFVVDHNIFDSDKNKFEEIASTEII